MAVLGAIDRSIEFTSPGYLYLADYPNTDPGANNTARLAAFFGYFFNVGDTRTAMKAGVNPWGNLSPDGVKWKMKEEVIENETNESAKHVVARIATGMDLEFSFFDVNVAHFADAVGAKADEIIAQAAAAGKAGRLQLLLGGSRNLPKYVLLYRTPSQKFAGQYDNFLFFRCVITVDFELALNKKDLRKVTLKVSVMPDNYVTNADGYPEMAVIDEVTAAAL